MLTGALADEAAALSARAQVCISPASPPASPRHLHSISTASPLQNLADGGRPAARALACRRFARGATAVADEADRLVQSGEEGGETGGEIESREVVREARTLAATMRSSAFAEAAA